MLFEKGEVELKIENIVIVDSEVERNVLAEYVLIEDLPFEAIQFLLPSRYCHSDTQEIIQLASEITKNIEIVGEALGDETRIEVPTLFIKGDKSNYILADDEVLINKIFSHATIETIANAGHWVQAEQPQEFAEVVAKFI